MNNLNDKRKIKDIFCDVKTKSILDWITPFFSTFPESISGNILNISLLDLSTYNKNSDNVEMINTLRYLTNIIRLNTDIHFDLYSDEEKANDPTKNQSGLVFLPGKKNWPFVIIIPGGGYSWVSVVHEGFVMAQAMTEIGYNAFVLKYRTGNGCYPQPMEDLSRAISLIISKQKSLNISAKNYAIIGFSAGGHLAASFGTKSLGYEQYSLPKPKTIILGYPVISMTKHQHNGSRTMLLGNNPDMDLLRLNSLEEQVDKDYPDVYIWHCNNDKTVPVQNTIMFSEALKKSNVLVHTEIIDCEIHGLGLAKHSKAEHWVQEAISFWNPKYSIKE